jgi:predicted nuclease of predicted toxin-antitoxin system
VKFKLDENLGTRTQEIFRTAGHDIQTVRDEMLSATSDDHLYQVCQVESRCLVTLDLDFANTLRFPPENSSGIAVYRIPRNPSLSDLDC